MPIPTPTKGEDRAKFIDRCMGDELMVKEYKEGQRRAICEVQADYLEGEMRLPRHATSASKNSFKIAFYKSGKKTRKGYAVDVVAGSIEGVSLIQLGEAKGHGIYVDGLSLGSALEVLASSNLPAFITHAGALQDDRMLKQIGYFAGFYLDQGKLKAETFQSLESFRDDETESFNRLFDLAREMPDAFGLSLVFEAELVWVFKNGEEISVAESEGKPAGAVREMPSVRFNSISSADFVDEPAANEDGLFSTKRKKQKNIIMDDEQIETGEEQKIVLAEPEKEVEVDEIEIEGQPEETEQTEDDDEISLIKEELEALKAEVAQLNEKLFSKTEEAAKLSKQLDGEEIALSIKPSGQDTKAIVAKFNAATGGEQHRIWKQNKATILSALTRN